MALFVMYVKTGSHLWITVSIWLVGGLKNWNTPFSHHVFGSGPGSYCHAL